MRTQRLFRCSFATVLLATAANAQVRAWVDPYYGNDNSGVVDMDTAPYQTLGSAIASVGAHPSVMNGSQPGIVHALPGIYSAATNGETYPLMMASNVNLQGAGAKECVLDAAGLGMVVPMVPWPDPAMSTTGGPSGPLVRLGASVLVDFSPSGAGDELLDGFTLRGADILALFDAPLFALPLGGRISNCVFDMRDSPGTPGAFFGVLTCSTFSLFLPTGTYPDVDASLFNNTFIQGWKTGELPDDSTGSLPGSVAICDVSDPTLLDPNQAWRGVHDLHIQNNLIRCLPEALVMGSLRTAFLGVDQLDTSVASGANTNAFGAGLAGGTSFTGLFSSAIVGAPPVPAVDTLANDPAFFGEFLNATEPPPMSHFDARILPSSPMVDAGVAPTVNAQGQHALTAGNGRVHVDSLALGIDLASFDYDGEVHGNPRVKGVNVDIGFDESDTLMIGGNYGNDTKSHNIPWDPSVAVPAGTARRSYVTPTTEPFHLRMVLDPAQASTAPPPGWTVFPGTRALPLQSSAHPGFFDWLKQAVALSFYAGVQHPTATNWINWVDGSVEFFGRYLWVIGTDMGSSQVPYLSTQVHPITPTGLTSSNLQCEFY